MDLAQFRRRLALARVPSASLYGDDGTAEREAAGVIPAAVLIAVIDHPAEPSVLFTRRTAQLKKHSGQISFPGGRVEPSDAGAEFTALRETQEEIGLPPERVELIARLPEYFTRTGFRVVPVVGIVAPPLELVPDAREVDEIFEVPLAFILDPANHRRASREIGGRTAHYYEIEHHGRVIWGATAGMIVNLYRMLA